MTPWILGHRVFVFETYIETKSVIFVRLTTQRVKVEVLRMENFKERLQKCIEKEGRYFSEVIHK
jgi:hypothetical protein